MKKPNVIQEKSFDFAVTVISLYKYLKNNKEFDIARQLLKSGTSIGANVEEGIAAQSRPDFISKMSIASKEARETRYWLRLLNTTKLVKYDYSKHLNDIDEIILILSSIVKTTKENPR